MTMEVVSHPTLVIGVPAYNEGRFIAATLQSLQEQTWQDFSVLISDNASADDTAEQCARYCSADDRFHYVRQDENIGSARNFQFLMEHTSSPFFMWMGGHDRLSPDYLERHLEVMRRSPSVVLSYAYTLFIDSDGQPIRTTDGGGLADLPAQRWLRYFRAIRRTGECTSINQIIRRTALNGVDWKPVAGADEIVLSHVLFQGPANCIPEPMYMRRESDDESSTRMAKLTGDMASSGFDFRKSRRAYVQSYVRLPASWWLKIVYLPLFVSNVNRKFCLGIWRWAIPARRLVARRILGRTAGSRARRNAPRA